MIFNTREELRTHNQKVHHIQLAILSGKTKQFACPYCFEEFDTKQQLCGHLANCTKHPNKIQHDETHKKAGQTLKEHIESGQIKSTSHPCSNETRQHLSEVRAEQVRNEYLTNFHAKVKWYKVKNIKGEEFSVRGHWEENVAKRLNELNIYWIKAQPIKYFKDYYHNYTADFYIPIFDIYVEVKGRYPDTDRKKMRLVIQQNPNKKIYFIHDSYFNFIEGRIGFDDNLLIKSVDL